ncbi:MAG: hypothetical protein IJ236_03505, partial [Oscillospiraceae bacterium]|nr:hypothetical protein [Oscillospiraceae bacterium]
MSSGSSRLRLIVSAAPAVASDVSIRTIGTAAAASAVFGEALVPEAVVAGRAVVVVVVVVVEPVVPVVDVVDVVEVSVVDSVEVSVVDSVEVSVVDSVEVS